MTPAPLAAAAPKALQHDDNDVAIEPRVKTRLTMTWFKILEEIPKVGPVRLLEGGSRDHLATQLGVWKELLTASVERIQSLGGEAREAEIRAAAVLAVQYRRTMPIYNEAVARENEKAQREREAEERRQQDLVAEHNECVRLRRVALGLD